MVLPVRLNQREGIGALSSFVPTFFSSSSVFSPWGCFSPRRLSPKKKKGSLQLNLTQAMEPSCRDTVVRAKLAYTDGCPSLI